MFRPLFLILSGNAAGAFLVLASTLIIARLIPVEDFGIAATFVMTTAMLQMVSDIGMNQQIIQARDGNDPHLQAALQGFQVMRGLALGLFMFAIAHPIAQFLDVPEVTWGYQLLAIAPVISAFSHFDTFRHTRTMNYVPSALTGTMPAFISILAVWPLVEIFGDWRVMLYTILLRRVVGVATGHLLSKRPYRLAFDHAIIARSVRFGWPLMINGALLYLVFQGEKLIVGRELGMATLAILAMGFTLTLSPLQVATGTLRSFFLPQLSAVQDDRQRFAYLATVLLQASLLVGAVAVTIITFAGAPVVHALLGVKYAPLIPLLGWMTVLNAVWICKSSGAVIALARAETKNGMIANLCRVASLPVSWYALNKGAGLTEVIWIAIGGELCGFVVALLLIRYKLSLSLRRTRLPLVLMAALVATIIPGIVPSGISKGLVMFSFLVALIGSMHDLRRYLRRRVVTKFNE